MPTQVADLLDLRVSNREGAVVSINGLERTYLNALSLPQRVVFYNLPGLFCADLGQREHWTAEPVLFVNRVKHFSDSWH